MPDLMAALEASVNAARKNCESGGRDGAEPAKPAKKAAKPKAAKSKPKAKAKT